jgi:hypothetical protein
MGSAIDDKSMSKKKAGSESKNDSEK